MNFVLFRKLLRDLRWPLFWVGLLLVAFEILWAKITQRITIEIVPEVKKLAPLKKMAEILFSGSGKFIQSVLGGDTINLESAADILSIGYVHPTVITIFGIWAIGRAAGALAGEMDRGTMELLLAQPIARWRVVVTHFVLDLVIFPYLCLCMLAGTYVGIHLFDIADLSLAAYWGALVNAAALMLALSGFTMAFSAAGRSRWRVLAVVIGVLLVLFLVNVLGQMWDGLRPWRVISPYYYYQPQLIILKDIWTVPLVLSDATGGSVPVPMVAVLAVMGLVGYAIALVTFCRRDLPAPL